MRRVGLPLCLAFALPACARSPEPAATESNRATAPTITPVIAAKRSMHLPPVVVHKSASCGCCASWVEHMRKNGFEVDVHNEDNLNPIKQHVGVPVGKGSCHTAEVGGYFVEGHVPADDIKRLLTEKPDAKGVVIPGMPAGSPGMEMPDGTTQPYTVELVGRDGSTTSFARH
ncbi:MAG: DUF411 domain-containing protein [Luteimonas sp.]